MDELTLNAFLAPLLPHIKEEDKQSLRDYHSFYMLYRDELSKEGERLFADHPIFGAMIQNTPREVLEKESERTNELQRKAIYEDDWLPYARNTVQQGIVYAQLGLVFSSWYDIINLARDLIIPRAILHFRDEPEKAFSVLRGLHKMCDIAMCILGEAYLYEKQRIINEQIIHQENLNKELEQFAYIASHDLQEPLRTITSFVELFSQQYKDKVDDNGKQYIRFMTEASNRMGHLIKGLLDYSRIGSSSQLTEIDLPQLLEGIRSDLKTSITESNAEIIIGEIPPVIYGYEVELRLVFQNLISNAMKFSKKDVPPRILISGQTRDREWFFSVSDNGIGINPKFFDNIFKLYQRLHSKHEYPGSGIGLSHSKKVVEMHGGKIGVESVPGEGSTFYFTIAKNKKL